MRRSLGAFALILAVMGSIYPAHPVGQAAGGRSVYLDYKWAGITKASTGKGNSVLVCQAHAKGQVAVLTTIKSCTLTGPGGVTLKAVTPITAAGPYVVAVGEGKTRAGFNLLCITASATYARPSQTITKNECFGLII